MTFGRFLFTYYFFVSIMMTSSVTGSNDFMPKIPEKGMESVKIAIDRFNIKIPENVTLIYYNPNNKEDRAVTLARIDGARHVYVTDMAFTSWGMLGATLLHELEVHCVQDMSFVWDKSMDKHTKKSIIASYEREAYNYEISNANRLGLTEKEIRSIIYTRNKLYPIGEIRK